MEMEKVKPAIYRFTENTWGWVEAMELAQVCGYVDPHDLARDFIGLSKDEPILALMIAGLPGETWRFVDAEFMEVTDSNGVFVDEEGKRLHTHTRKWFVPAGWAMDVLRAIELGTCWIEMIPHEHKSNLDGCPDGALTCRFTGYDFVSAVGFNTDGEPVDYCERPAPKRVSAGCKACAQAGMVLEGHSLCRAMSTEELADVDNGRAYLTLDDRYGWQLVYE